MKTENRACQRPTMTVTISKLKQKKIYLKLKTKCRLGIDI